MHKTYKALIIGGGAAGLLCAAELLTGENALSGQDVLIIERGERLARKLLATGNGQCNLCNRHIAPENYYGDKNFIVSFIKSLEEISLERYFLRLGIPFYTDEDGRQYPLSRQAGAVSDGLRSYIAYKNCCIVTGQKVMSLSESGGIFAARTDKGEYFAQNAVIAVGGAAAKQFGTDGSSYNLAESFGHRVTPLKPSLVQLKTELAPIRGLKGIKERAEVTVYDGNKPLRRAAGDVLFTEYGVSGSAIFTVSPLVVGAREPCISVGFLPGKSVPEVRRLIELRAAAPHVDKSELLSALVNKRLGQAILKRAAGKDPAAELKDFRLKVTGALGFDSAQVTRGGIETNGVDPVTMESRIKGGLFIAGEALDIDGDCGGYNLAFAFGGGIAAARAIKQKYDNKEKE